MRLIPYQIRKIWTPPIFQGASKRRRYFEGWYYKLVSARGEVVAVIPGVSYGEDGTGTAFIQIIEGRGSGTAYFPYEVSDLSFSRSVLDLGVGRSRFTDARLSLDIEGDGRRIAGEIRLTGTTPLKRSLLSPGIMGWFAFAPFMECYHGVVSLDHGLEGALEIDGTEIDFTGGRGYTEKDWGRSFPSSWIWVQSNHFSHNGISVMLSVARIPWLGGSFPGFLCVLLLSGVQYRFATYTGARITRMQASASSVFIRIEDGKHSLEIRAVPGKPGGLKAPVNGAMDRVITESVTSRVSVRLEDAHGAVVLEDSGVYGGMEIAGDLAEIIPPNV